MPRPKTAPARGVLQTTADVPPIVHQRYHPSDDLAPFIEHFWLVRWDLRGRPPHRAETLPHPSAHLIFDADKGSRLAGVSRSKFVTVLEGKGGVFAAKFRPGGFYPFAGRPLSGFTDSVVTLDSVWGKDGDVLERAVLEAGDDDARIKAVEDFLRRQRPLPDEEAALSATIVYAIADDRTLTTVEHIAERFAMNLRKLQRLFARYVGVSPKWVVQRYRLHEAAERLARGAASQSALALELGYADQSHFVKDFKAIVGTTPAAYARRAGQSA